jgi:hypothetical protein
LCRFFLKDKADKPTTGAKPHITDSHKQDEDVAFYWCLAVVDMDDGLATILLDGIVELWVTIRGFSFASAWVKKYKQESKKSLQRSKGL